MLKRKKIYLEKDLNLIIHAEDDPFTQIIANGFAVQ